MSYEEDSNSVNVGTIASADYYNGSNIMEFISTDGSKTSWNTQAMPAIISTDGTSWPPAINLNPYRENICPEWIEIDPTILERIYAKRKNSYRTTALDCPPTEEFFIPDLNKNIKLQRKKITSDPPEPLDYSKFY